MTKASIDILLTYWGDFELFKKTVDSVIAQTDKRWCLRIFDDCYPSDEAEKYCRSLNDKRVIYYRHKKNIGITKNFNYALQSATAPYCVMPGCDDILLPNYVETALNSIGDADFMQPGVQVIDVDDRVYSPLVDKIKTLLRPNRAATYGGEKLAVSLCIGNWLYFPSILWKTEVIQKYGFNEKYKIAEDLVLELELIKDGKMLAVNNTVIFQYRRFANSLSSREKSKNGVRFDEENGVYDRFESEFKNHGWNKAALSAKLRVSSRLHQLIAKI